MSAVHVAVGVILNAQKEILLTRRASDAHQGGLWEFPGGKVEPGESLESALDRELQEELGIRPLNSFGLIKIEHDYGDKQVLLDVHVVDSFSGEPKGLEGQPMVWVGVGALAEYQFPAANLEIVTAVEGLLA